MQPGETRKYGTTIAPGLYAPVHQHFFVARMDMAVDCRPGEAFNQVSFYICSLYLSSLVPLIFLLLYANYCFSVLFFFSSGG